MIRRWVLVPFVFAAALLGIIATDWLHSQRGGIEYVTLHHLYVLNGDGTRIVANPTIVWGDDGFACQGDDELLRTEFVRDKETDLLMLACFWSQRY
jgi:hypothetical protein